MANEFLGNQLGEILQGFTEQMADIERIQQRIAVLVGTGYAERKRVTVCVNAEGTIVETRFSDDIDELTYDEIAAAVTAAGQAAKQDVAKQVAELQKPIMARRSRMPKLTDIVEDMPDLAKFMPAPPKISTAPPGAAERQVTEESGFTEAEKYQLKRDTDDYKDSAW